MMPAVAYAQLRPKFVPWRAMTTQETDAGHAVPDAHPRVFFDGICNLCNASVRWLIEHDRKARFRLASLQSVAARRELEKYLPRDQIEALPDAIVLIDEKGIHTRSTAALRIASGLGLPWSMLSAGLVVPRVLRDAVYDFVARNRYRWFGHRDACMVPTPETAARFLDADEPAP